MDGVSCNLGINLIYTFMSMFIIRANYSLPIGQWDLTIPGLIQILLNCSYVPRPLLHLDFRTEYLIRKTLEA